VDTLQEFLLLQPRVFNSLSLVILLLQNLWGKSNELKSDAQIFEIGVYPN
jgi:hypothetical protein